MKEDAALPKSASRSIADIPHRSTAPRGRAAHFWIKQILEKSFQVPDAVPALFIVDH